MPGPNYRGMARPLLEGLVGRGYTTKSIQKSLQDAGLSYRYQSLLDDIREIGNIQKRGRTFSSIPLSKLPTPRTIGITSKVLSSPFMYTAKVGFYDPIADKTNYRWRSMTVDKVRSRGALQQRFIDLAGEDAETYGLEITGVSYEKLEMRDTAEYAWEPDDSPW